MSRRNDPLFEAYLFETRQLVEEAELILIRCEKVKHMDAESIHEIFRAMHSIKGSSAMMEYGCMAETAHSVEDLFYYIRQENPQIDFNRVSDIILNVLDFMKSVLDCIENDAELPQINTETIQSIYAYLDVLKGKPPAKDVPGDAQQKAPEPLNPSPESSPQEETGPDPGQRQTPVLNAGCSPQQERPSASKVVWVQFDDDCSMESVRAFGLVKQLEQFAAVLETNPENLQDFDRATEFIRKNGLEVFVDTERDNAEIEKYVRDNTVYLKDCRVDTLMKKPKPASESMQNEPKKEEALKSQNKPASRQSFISVNVKKLDKLMDIVGELVISELMVVKNPEITGMKLNSFRKAANRLKKMTDELQDIVMSIRMVPVGATFHGMQRIVRDMCKKLEKEAELIISGEETEVDKNIIEAISDPLVHLIRNSIDHGIEDPETRKKLGKPAGGRIFLEARNEGGDVWITVRDDGGGLNREAILKKARENGLVTKDEKEFSDAEVWKFILAPGFSTKKDVSQYSGRGVGLDVVIRNIEKTGGQLHIDSKAGEGTTFSIRFPLTLAIIDGMEVSVGKSHYTVPIASVREAIKPVKSDIVSDSEGREAVLIRGNCMEVVRLHKEFNVHTDVVSLEQGILVIVQNDVNTFAIFADKLLGEHQVVVKPVPDYMGKIKGVSGCSVMGDGRISLILDVAGLLERKGRTVRGV